DEDADAEGTGEPGRAPDEPLGAEIQSEQTDTKRDERQPHDRVQLKGPRRMAGPWRPRVPRPRKDRFRPERAPVRPSRERVAPLQRRAQRGATRSHEGRCRAAGRSDLPPDYRAASWPWIWRACSRCDWMIGRASSSKERSSGFCAFGSRVVSIMSSTFWCSEISPCM